jgi:hypothetical protein
VSSPLSQSGIPFAVASAAANHQLEMTQSISISNITVVSSTKEIAITALVTKQRDNTSTHT